MRSAKTAGLDAGEQSLVASGQMTLPTKILNHRRFWTIGAGTVDSNLREAIQSAIDAERKENDARF